MQYSLTIIYIVNHKSDNCVLVCQVEEMCWVVPDGPYGEYVHCYTVQCSNSPIVHLTWPWLVPRLDTFTVHTEDKSIYSAPIEDKSIYSAPIEGKWICSAPIEGKSIYSAPIEGKSIYSAPIEGKSIYSAPRGQSIYSAPRGQDNLQYTKRTSKFTVHQEDKSIYSAPRGQFNLQCTYMTSQFTVHLQ